MVPPLSLHFLSLFPNNILHFLAYFKAKISQGCLQLISHKLRLLNGFVKSLELYPGNTYFNRNSKFANTFWRVPSLKFTAHCAVNFRSGLRGKVPRKKRFSPVLCLFIYNVKYLFTSLLFCGKVVGNTSLAGIPPPKGIKDFY